MPGVWLVGEDAETPSFVVARPERPGVSGKVAVAERLPDDSAQLRCPAQQVGGEDRSGHYAEEAGPEETLTTQILGNAPLRLHHRQHR